MNSTKDSAASTQATAVTTIMAHVRRTNRNKLICGGLLAGLGVTLLLLDTSHAYWPLYIGILAAGAALVAITVAGMFWPRYNLILRRLAKFGEPQHVADAIDAELSQSELVLTFGQRLQSFTITGSEHPPIILTPSWLLQLTELGMRVVCLDGITWIYKKVEITNSVHRRCFVIVHERDGRQETFGQTEAEVDRLMATLARLLPKTRLGFP